MRTRAFGSIGLFGLLLAAGEGCGGDVTQMAPGSDAAAGQTGNGGSMIGNGGAAPSSGGGAGAGGSTAGAGAAGSGGISGAGGAGATAGFAGNGGAAGTDASVGAGGASGIPLMIFGGAAGVAPDGGGSGYPDSAIPPGMLFVQAETGAYARGAAITGSGVANTGVKATASPCNIIAGVVRDFKDSTEGGHPDFEAFTGTTATVALVNATLGSDGKPVYTGICEIAGVTAACPFGQQTTSKATFDQWYRYTDGVNKPFIIYLQFEQVGSVMSFQSANFFPLDGAGWGNNHTRGDGPHNFAFTTELHTKFKYLGGETFTFIGDDDVWVFVNGKRAMDLGGLHQKTTYTINLDASAAALGLARGNEYTLDLFHAERHTWESNFRIDTNIAFTDCGTVIAPDVK